MAVQEFIDEHFQKIVLAAFIVIAVVAVAVFALQRTDSGDTTVDVEIWGTISERVFRDSTDHLTRGPDAPFAFTYRRVDSPEFDDTLLEALALDQGPDLILLPHDKIVLHFDKILPIPYEVYSQRRFKDTFLEAGEIYMRTGGIAGLPFLADPLVMYWNRDLVTSAGFASPPATWEEMRAHVKRITVRRGSSDIRKATLAFGEFSNVENAKEALSLLLFQTGNSITARQDNRYGSVLAERRDGALAGADAALRFYTEFSDPVKEIYTWNRALRLDRDEFISGNLAYYFGKASEVRGIQERNPNLNFDVAPVPQQQGPERRHGYTDLLAVSIMRKSSNPEGALRAAAALSGRETVKNTAERMFLPPVRRDLLSNAPNDAVMSVLYDSAIISSVWLDPNPAESSRIFKNMVENVTSGRLRTSEALERAHDELNELFIVRER